MEKTMLTRRHFVATAAGTFAATTLIGADAAAGERPLVRFGLVTDPHSSGSMASTQPPHEVRAFRESPAKMREFVDVMNARRVDFVVELGDFAECHERKADTVAALDEIEGVFGGFKGPRYHVLGNHDLQGLAREEIAPHIVNTGVAAGRTYYSFERGGVTFAVLDHGYYADGTPMTPGNTDWTKGHLSAAQWEWFDSVVAKVNGFVVTLSHWRLDPNGRGGLEALDAGTMRKRFAQSGGKVKASFCGHHHYGDYGVWDGVGYYCQRAMVTGSGAANSSYTEVAVYPSGRFSVTGFRKARTVAWG